MKFFLFILFFVMSAAVADGVDQREVLSLNEAQRNHLLKEMRMLLTGTGAILEALAREDMTAVARHARSLGMEMPHKMEGHMDNVLPQQFMQLGMGMHQRFDEIARDAESKKDGKHTLQQLGETLGSCTACHAIYQIAVNRSSQESGDGNHGADSHHAH